MTDRLPHLRLRVATRTLLAALALAAPPPAEARRLVEPGDLLVGAGDLLCVVRADGGGVAPFSPREGSGANQLHAPSGIAVDGARERVFATDFGGALLLIDPEDGAQTRVENNLGGTLPVGDTLSGLDILGDGSLLVGSIDVSSGFPLPSYAARIDLVSTPNDQARAIVAPASDPLGSGPIGFLVGLSVAEPGIGDTQLLVTVLNGLGSALSSVSPDGTVTPIAGVPMQENALVTEPDVDCSAGLASLCVRYWAEARIVSTDCIPSDATIFRASFGGTQEIFSGPPLRCPFAVEAASSGDQVFVLDANPDFTEPRIHRLDRNPISDEFTAVLIADDTELPDLANVALPGLAISPVALPEPAAGGAAAALLALAVLGSGRRRRP